MTQLLLPANPISCLMVHMIKRFATLKSCCLREVYQKPVGIGILPETDFTFVYVPFTKEVLS